MRGLVIGGGGYIGSHMVLQLLDNKWEVSVFDNFSRGFRDAVPADLKRCFQEGPFDVVFHFAALAYVDESVTCPALYYQNNVIGSINLVDAMLAQNSRNIVFSSSCATYGGPDKIPISEEQQQSPINPYGQTKLMVEKILADYSRAHQLNSVSLRYFNAAGADPLGRAGERHNPETHIIPLILREAMRLRNGGDPADTPLKVFGSDFDTADGTCVRDFIHVTDLCGAHLLAADLLRRESSGARCYNLANGHGFSVLDAINICRKVTGMPIEYTLCARRAGDPAALVGDSSLANKELGWQPQITSLEKIIESAWNWMLGDRSVKSPVAR